MSTIGSRIKSRREELGLSQDELAARCGYTSRSTITRIEKDCNKLRQDKIAVFANALETTPAYIMGWAEDSTHPDSELKAQFMLEMDKLTEPQLKSILALMRSFSDSRENQ